MDRPPRAPMTVFASKMDTVNGQVQLVESIDRQSMKAVLPRPDRIFRQHPQQLAGAASPSGGSSMGSSDVPVPSSGAWWRRSGDPLALAAPGGTG